MLGRFGAPLYLAGESYGTTRGAATRTSGFRAKTDFLLGEAKGAVYRVFAGPFDDLAAAQQASDSSSST